MNSYTECLMLQNMEILTGRKKNLSNEENELKCKLKSIIMLNDVVKVMNSRASSIQLNKIDGDNVLLNYYSKNGLDRLVTDYIPKYGFSGIFNAKEIKDYSDNQTEKLQKAVDAGKITIKFPIWQTALRNLSGDWSMNPCMIRMKKIQTISTRKMTLTGRKTATQASSPALSSCPRQNGIKSSSSGT